MIHSIVCRGVRAKVSFDDGPPVECVTLVLSIPVSSLRVEPTPDAIGRAGAQLFAAAQDLIGQPRAAAVLDAVPPTARRR